MGRTINHIELASKDLTETKKFYSRLFGWNFLVSVRSLDASSIWLIVRPMVALRWKCTCLKILTLEQKTAVSCQFFNKWPRKRRLKRWDLRFVHILMGFSVQILSASSRRSVTVIPVVYSPFVSIFTERSMKSYREGWITAPTAIGS